MTKYVLSGGRDSTRSEAESAEFAAEVRGDREGDLKVLSCLFAEKPEEWQAVYAQKSQYYAQVFGDGVQTELADPTKFEDQVDWADVVYIHGGDVDILASYLDKLDLTKLFKDKIVVGSSAGGEYLCEAYYTMDGREVRVGRGVVHAAMAPHFGADTSDRPGGPTDWDKVKTDLGNLAAGAPTYLLPERDFVVVNQE